MCSYVHNHVTLECERMWSLGVKVTTSLLLQVCRNAVTMRGNLFPGNNVCTLSGKTLLDQIDRNFVYHYCQSRQVVRRMNVGSKSRSALNLLIEKKVIFHLASGARAFWNNEYDGNAVENMDEAHFLYDFDNRACLSLRGSKSVGYMDFVSGEEAMTVTFSVTGGLQARIAAPFFSFKNKSENYPIQGSPDNIHGVSYRTQVNRWMNGHRFIQWLSEPRAIQQLPNFQQRILFFENCSGHRSTVEVREALHNIKKSLNYVPANSTHLCLPLDSFLIRKFKSIWLTKLDLEKPRRCELLQISTASDKIKHLNKQWYMPRAVTCDNNIMSARDENWVSYARKCMIRFGFLKAQTEKGK